MQMQAMAPETERRRKQRRVKLLGAFRRIENGEFGYRPEGENEIPECRPAVEATFSAWVACAGM